jgi:2-isopropylmalate synthase
VVKDVQSRGVGPVDAVFNAIQKLVPNTAKLQLYEVHAVTAGTDAQAEVTVRLEEDGKTVNGSGADADTLVASARAYINALNRLFTKRQRTAPAGPAAEASKPGAAGSKTVAKGAISA